MKNKRLLPIMLVSLLTLVGCTTKKPSESSSKETETASSEVVTSEEETSGGETSSEEQQDVYTLAIMNKESLEEDWDAYGAARSITLQITKNGSPVVAAMVLNDITVEADVEGIFNFAGLTVKPLGVGAEAVTVTVSYQGVSDSFTVKVTAPEWVDLATIVALDDLPADSKNADILPHYATKGVVATKTSKGFILDDGVDAAYIYGTTIRDQVEVGDYIGLDAGWIRYHTNILEGCYPTLITVFEGEKPTTRIGNPTEITAASWEAGYEAMTELVPVTVWGTIYLEGTYKALKPEDGEVTYPIETSDLPSDFSVNVGDCLNLTGYMVYDAKYHYGALYVDSMSTHIIGVTGVEIAEPASTTVYVDGTLQLSASVLPANATVKDVEWSSSDAEVATVDETGLVTGVAAGNVTITATSVDNNLALDTIDLVVAEAADPITGVSLNKNATTLKVGATETLLATVTSDGENFDNSVVWSSSDPEVATVDAEGVVTAVAAGSAVITATTNGKDAENNALTAECAVTVENYTIAEINAAGINMDVKGTVVFKNSSRMIVDDGTAATVVFEASGSSVLATLAVGDKVHVVGPTGVYSTTGFDITNATLEKLANDAEVPAPTVVEALSAEEAKAIFDANSVTPHGLVSLRTGVIGGSGSYLTWIYGECNMETALSTGNMVAGKTYDIEGYLTHVYNSQYLCICVTSATEVEIESNEYLKAFGYADLKANGVITGAVEDKTSYLLLSTETAYTINLDTEDHKPSGKVTVTFEIATFGSGANPSGIEFTIRGSEENTTWNKTGQLSALPTSSTYVNGTIEIDPAEGENTTLEGLVITFTTSAGKQIRLRTITVSYEK